jgi:prepilin-type N-terminal cleavage/methylation domain-containing protein
MLNNTMKSLKTKKSSKKGFTLMEMLIVVAIIAILVAIAIPTFTSSLNKAKAGADMANARSLYAAVQIATLTDDSSEALPAAGTPSSVTFAKTTYTFNSEPTIAYKAATATEDGSWSITTAKIGSTAAKTFTCTIPAGYTAK